MKFKIQCHRSCLEYSTEFFMFKKVQGLYYLEYHSEKTSYDRFSDQSIESNKSKAHKNCKHKFNEEADNILIKVCIYFSIRDLDQQPDCLKKLHVHVLPFLVEKHAN